MQHFYDPPLTSEHTNHLGPQACPLDLLCSEEDLLSTLDTTKSNGPDGISAKMLKGAASSIAPVFVKLLTY